MDSPMEWYGENEDLVYNIKFYVVGAFFSRGGRKQNRPIVQSSLAISSRGDRSKAVAKLGRNHPN